MVCMTTAVADTAERQPTRFLKWADDVIGDIYPDNSVAFRDSNFNEVVALYTGGQAAWSPEQFTVFLSERIASPNRRDIENILLRMGLSYYDVLHIAGITRGIHPKDMLWIAHAADEKMGDVTTDVFNSVFYRRVDLEGESIDTPEGNNIKRYGVYKGRYGIYKQRSAR